MEQFRRMVNDCIRIGLSENVTSLKSLSLRAYKLLSGYHCPSYYKLCAISATVGMLRNYRKAKRKNPHVNAPYARKSRLTTCYGFKIEGGNVLLPVRRGRRVSVPLTRRTQNTLSSHEPRSVTLTPTTMTITYRKWVEEVKPLGTVGIDRNLDNVTVAASDGPTIQYDLSAATRWKATYRKVKSHFKRNDYRIRRRICGKYGLKERNRVGQILHHASKTIIAEAKARQYCVVMERLTGIRRLYRRGNGQGRNYRAKMNSWSYAELQRQIQYKAKWEGIGVIYVPPRGTSGKCSRCGYKTIPEEGRMLRCLKCGVRMDRDVNAAKNIMAAGLRGLRFRPDGAQGEAMVREPRIAVIPRVDCAQLTPGGTHAPTS
jgi:IS605 OrfB family transposase